MAMPLTETIRDPLRRLHTGASGLVVAVSGGPDSVALLRALIAHRQTPSGGRLVVAHLNHCLRGADSDADEQFVHNLHARLIRSGESDLHLAMGRSDLAALTRASGGNLEAMARAERYRFLAEVAAQYGCASVATGHTADDQAETLLHRLLRGTGLQGLRSIAERRELHPGLTLIRPMLAVTRADVLAYLAQIDQPFRVDLSNADPRSTRNRIRRDLLPLLAAADSEIVRLLGEVARQASNWFDEVGRRASALLRECELPRAGLLRVLDAECLAAAPRDLLREALRQLWQREGWSRDRMRFADWDRIAAVVAGEILAVDLPGQISVRRRGRIVQIGPHSP
jgi:tRNA(Ile)-lysidine synthase